MIIKGSARAGGAGLAAHLRRTDTNERVAVLELRDVAGANLDQALREMEALASGTRCKSPLYHANIDPRADERLTPQQWTRAVDALEEKLGLTGQPRAVVQHVKDGRAHVHVVWSRIDVDRMRAIPDSHNYRKHEEVSRALEREFGHARVQGAHAEREGVERPARTPSRAEMQQAERSGIDPKAIKAELSDLWQRTDTGKAFAAALEDAGYCLARGDKRDFIVVDQAGEVHSLARRIDGAKAKDIRARMADVDPAGLPDAEGAQAIQAGRTRARAEQSGRAGAEGAGAVAMPLPEPAPALDSTAAGAAAPDVPPVLSETEKAEQRRQLLDAFRETRERVRVPEAVPEPVLSEAEKHRQLFDAFREARERVRVPEAAPVAPEPAPVAGQAQPAAVPEPADLDPAPLPADLAAPVPELAAAEVPAIDTAAQRRQALDAEQAEADAKRRRLEVEREAEEEERRRHRDARIQQEEAQLLAEQVRQEAAERKAMQEQQRAEWRRLENTEAVRAQRDGNEDDEIERTQADEDDAAKPRGLFAKLKSLFSPAAAMRNRVERQQRVEAQRIRDHADRLAARRARNAEGRARLTAAQARARELAEKARAERQAFEREELRKRQREREERELERRAIERAGWAGRGGRGGRGGHGGRGGIEM